METAYAVYYLHKVTNRHCGLAVFLTEDEAILHSDKMNMGVKGDRIRYRVEEITIAPKGKNNGNQV